MMIYITRHGQPASKDDCIDPQYPPGDPPLSELGRLQARKLGERLSESGFCGRIFASPYRRTAETADIIAAVNDLYFRPEPAVREVTSQHIVHFSGMRLEQMRSLFTRLAPEADMEWPWWSKEPEQVDARGRRPQVEARAGRFLEGVIGPGETDILIVGHAGSFSAMVEYLLERETVGEFARIGNTWNCALTAFRLDHDGLHPLYHGDTTHLAEEEVTANSQRPCDIKS